MVYYGKEYEEENKRQKKRTRQKTEAPAWLRPALKQPEKNAQVKRDGLIISVKRRGISSGVARRDLSCLQLQVQSAKEHTGEETALLGVGPRGQTPKTIRTEDARGSPHKFPS